VRDAAGDANAASHAVVDRQTVEVIAGQPEARVGLLVLPELLDVPRVS
jgi:hypothetical protein